MADRLQGKVAIVTGAGKSDDEIEGTGSATAIAFSREGASVLLVDMSPDNAEKTSRQIAAEGGLVSVFGADVTKEAECEAAVEAAVARFGKLDVLVNNVGITGSGTVTEFESSRWDEVLEVNLKSMVMMAKFAVPAMAAGGGGSIVNISSIDGLATGSSRNLPYAVAKGGVVSLTRNMAGHHGRQNIRTNCIAPGHIFGALVKGRMSAEMRQLRRKAAPLGVEGTARDVAMAALFLASDEARWISGVVLPVDAGLLATTPLAMYPYLISE
ncbi:MAG: SDR family NAD(P)-dependent oxidoreductase [Chloroflexi bacterium]|nr:SDR family NAD(P)-dependent oxidoreductase [Chloroflexota bacterium]MXY13167.1 SDR family oxidoreductase [Chloroflexota bacterium]